MFQRHFAVEGRVNASASELFAHLDDHNRLSGHMSKSSWMMLGSRMEVHADEGRGLRVGSVIRLDGAVLGVPLRVAEAIAEHVPPKRKSWETIGTPQLLVVGAYRMGFEIAPMPSGTLLRVFIDYDLPAKGLARLLGALLGPFYARWCTEQMLRDAQAHFTSATTPRTTEASAH
jgi:hypothetical protein